MSGDREPVCFVTDLLHQVQCRRAGLQIKTALLGRDVQNLHTGFSLRPFRDPHQQHFVDLEFLHDRLRRTELPLAAVDEDELDWEDEHTLEVMITDPPAPRREAVPQAGHPGLDEMDQAATVASMSILGRIRRQSHSRD